MKIYYSRQITLIGAVLIALMLRASYWQWERHAAKIAYIAAMESRLNEPIADGQKLFTGSMEKWRDSIYRRVQVTGEYDFAREVVMRNRSLDGLAGVHVITPLKLDTGSQYILVNRGFIPLEVSKPQERKIFQQNSRADFTGLVKESASRRFLAPADHPAGHGRDWVDSWLRVDAGSMASQLPYPIAPVYLEVMQTSSPQIAAREIVRADSGREELLFMGLGDVLKKHGLRHEPSDFPVPVFDAVIPPGRHLGYVYEWAVMALMTGLICLVLQLRPGRH